LNNDQARSQAYRWGEDGLALICDVEQRLCLVLGGNVVASDARKPVDPIHVLRYE
jgi:hypothetical protein